MTRLVRRQLAYAGGFTALVLLGTATYVPAAGLAVLWPASGLAVVWMLGAARPRALAATAAATWSLQAVCGLLLVAALGHGPSPATLLCLAAATTTQAVACRLLIGLATTARPLGRPTTDLGRTRDVVALLGAAAASAAVASPLASLAADVPGAGAPGDAVLWWLRATVSTFVVTAGALEIARSVRSARLMLPGRLRRVRLSLTSLSRRGEVGELVALAATTLVLAVLVGGWSSELPTALLVAVGAWTGSRFSPVVVGVHALTTSLVVGLVAASAPGRAASGTDPVAHLAAVELLVGAMVVVELVLASSRAEQARLTVALDAAQDEASGRADLLEAIAGTMTDAIIVVDDEARIRLESRAAEAWTADATTVRPWERAADAGRVTTLDGTPLRGSDLPFRRVLADGAPVSATLVHTDGDGRRVVDVTASAVPDPVDPRRRLAAVLLSDVTVERDRLEALEVFAGQVAHDLRNPLTALLSWVDLLRLELEGVPDELARGPRACLPPLERSADRMTQLIEDLLVFTRVQTAELDPVEVDLDDTLAEVVDGLGADGVLAPTMVRAGDLGVVRADPVLLRHVLTNVVHNAVKYVADGVVPAVEVRTWVRAGRRVVEVADNGIGIPEESRDRVFDSFFRAHPDYPGTGLGLAMCARAVARHGGAISAHGNPATGGSIVRFDLPGVAPEPQPAGRAAARNASAG